MRIKHYKPETGRWETVEIELASLSLNICPVPCPDHGRHCVHPAGEGHDHRCTLDAPALATPEG